MGRALTHELVSMRAKCGRVDLIKNLNVWGNDLQDISVIQSMPNLEVLSLSVNRVTTLRDLQHCAQLSELYLRNNNIIDLSEILHLKHLKRMKVIWLSDNPCACLPFYRQYILHHLPGLTKIDAQDVTEEERRAARLVDFTGVETCVGELRQSIQEAIESPVANDLQDTMMMSRHQSGGLQRRNSGEQSWQDQYGRRPHSRMSLQVDGPDNQDCEPRQPSQNHQQLCQQPLNTQPQRPFPHQQSTFGLQDDDGFDGGPLADRQPATRRTQMRSSGWESRSPPQTYNQGVLESHQFHPCNGGGPYLQQRRSIEAIRSPSESGHLGFDNDNATPNLEGLGGVGASGYSAGSGVRRFSAAEAWADRAMAIAEGEPAEPRIDNLLCATLALVKELDGQALALVRRAVEQRLAEL